HRKWVESRLENGDNFREDKWTDSIAVGSERFIGNIKALMGGMALGRRRIESGESFQLRETQSSYIALLGAKKSDIAPDNTYVWD
ncbi:MAG: transposase, partial [Desulfobacterales bacterium]|nr:transposase [Desulfobacterales bacterium]